VVAAGWRQVQTHVAGWNFAGWEFSRLEFCRLGILQVDDANLKLHHYNVF
jgi:hypothetical protein